MCKLVIALIQSCTSNCRFSPPGRGSILPVGPPCRGGSIRAKLETDSLDATIRNILRGAEDLPKQFTQYNLFDELP
jgi:hypothetical protein